MSTMICHNCGNENPADSKFCNNCGTRLASSQAPAGGPSREIFSQPGQPAGEPEEQDWDDGIPDWLASDQGGAPGAGDDLDLPTWLLDDGGTSGGPGSDAARTDSADAAEQELPEWLRGLAPKGTGPLPSSRSEGEEETPKPSLDDWLADLDEPEGASQSPSWLTSIEAEEADTATPVEDWPDALQGGFEDAGDWLGDLDIGDSEPAAPEAGENTWGSVAQSGFDMDEWLAELEPAGEQSEPEAPEASPAGDDGEDTGIPDWLAVDMEAAPPAGTARFDALEVIPDWLADLEAESDGPEGTGPAETVERDAEPAGALFAESAEVAPVPDVLDDDWLTSLEDDWREERADAGEAGVPDWLTVSPVPEHPEGASGEPLPDWLQDDTLPAEADEATEGETGSVEAPALDWWPAGEEAPDWLMVADAPEEGGEAVEAADEDPDWLTELDAAIGELEAASQEAVPGIPDVVPEQGPAAGAEETETAGAEAVEGEEMLPSWLAATELRTHLDEVAFEPLDKAQVDAGAGDEDEDEPVTGEPVGSLPDWLQELETAAPAAELTEEMALPDWLQEAAHAGAEEEAAGMDEQEPAFEAVPEEDGEDEGLPEWLAAVTIAGVDEMTEPAEIEQPEAAERWLLEDRAAEESPEVGAILGEESGDEIVGADELPDWFGDVMSAGDEELPAYLDDPEALPGVLAGPDLPGWLGDSLPDEERAEPTPLEELPPWLVPPVVAEARQPELLSEVDESGEWADVLGSVAESEASGAELSAAEVPEWLEALRPRAELRASEAPSETEPVTAGPLAGLRGAVPVMPVVAESRSAEYAGASEASIEQQEQAELLRQLVRQEPQDITRVVAGSAVRAGPSPWLRVAMALLLFGAVLIGLFLPELVAVETTPVMPISPAIEALEAASGQPVLVIFDYSPAYAGILNDQANALLQTLAAQGSPVVYASQSAAGLGLGAAAVEAVDGLQAARLGYIAGEAVGLRQLARCLGAEPGAAACESYPPGTGETAAILLLTGERDSLVDWIEQVEATSEVPLIAGVTEALVPVAAPYYATGQLDGVLAGQAATAAVAQASGVQAGRPSILPLTLAAWLAAALLLAGNIVYFFIGLAGSRRTGKA